LVTTKGRIGSVWNTENLLTALANGLSAEPDIYKPYLDADLGNSGPPVFVDLGGMRGGSLRLDTDYRLLGVVSSAYGEGEQNNLVLETPLASKPGNSGIAMIVPASALKALLNDRRVVAMRGAEVARQAQTSKK
jgi:hypothetical protein